MFAPSLFIGVTSGMAFGEIAHHIFGAAAGQPALYAVVAMGAVFASAARAPLTSLASVVEMTGDFALTLPVMLAVAIATAISRALSYGTIYTTKLLRRGTDIDRATPWRALQDLKVADAMRPFPAPLPAAAGPARADGQRAPAATALPGPVTYRRDPQVLFAGESLDQALRQLVVYGRDGLPVLSDDGQSVQGWVTNNRVLQTIAQKINTAQARSPRASSPPSGRCPTPSRRCASHPPRCADTRSWKSPSKPAPQPPAGHCDPHLAARHQPRLRAAQPQNPRPRPCPHPPPRRPDHPAHPCNYTPKAAGTACDDGNPATTADVCNGSGTCAGIACSTPPNSLCYNSPGTPSGGSCNYTPKPAGTACGAGQILQRLRTVRLRLFHRRPALRGGRAEPRRPLPDVQPGPVHLRLEQQGRRHQLQRRQRLHPDRHLPGRRLHRAQPGHLHRAATSATPPAPATRPTGACSNPAKANGTACNDGNACTQTDTCQSGTCTGAQPGRSAPRSTSATSPAPATRPPAPARTRPRPTAPPATTATPAPRPTPARRGTCTGSNPVVCAALDQCHVGRHLQPGHRHLLEPGQGQRHRLQRRQRLHRRPTPARPAPAPEPR